MTWSMRDFMRGSLAQALIPLLEVARLVRDCNNTYPIGQDHVVKEVWEMVQREATDAPAELLAKRRELKQHRGCTLDVIEETPFDQFTLRLVEIGSVKDVAARKRRVSKPIHGQRRRSSR